MNKGMSISELCFFSYRKLGTHLTKACHRTVKICVPIPQMLMDWLNKTSWSYIDMSWIKWTKRNIPYIPWAWLSPCLIDLQFACVMCFRQGASRRSQTNRVFFRRSLRLTCSTAVEDPKHGSSLKIWLKISVQTNRHAQPVTETLNSQRSACLPGLWCAFVQDENTCRPNWRQG